MALFKVFLLAVTLSGCAHTYSNSSLQDIPDFESLVGSGVLETSGTTIETQSIEASIQLNENFTVEGSGICTAFTLTTPEEPVLSIALCNEGSKYIFCGNKLDNCASDFKTENSGTSLSLIRDLGFGYDEKRFLVEFHRNKIIYRIQGETCLIGYPHGCIIDGFSWVDSKTYIYKF